jgi:hypothetical protein
MKFTKIGFRESLWIHNHLYNPLVVSGSIIKNNKKYAYCAIPHGYCILDTQGYIIYLYEENIKFFNISIYGRPHRGEKRVYYHRDTEPVVVFENKIHELMKNETFELI